MLTIRFSRVGKKNYAQYKVVLAEKTSPIKGKTVEILGSYDPHQKKSVLKDERIKYWISKGASCSDTAWNLFLKKGIVSGNKRKVKIPSKKSQEEKSTGAPKTEVSETVTPKVEASETEKPKA